MDMLKFGEEEKAQARARRSELKRRKAELVVARVDQVQTVVVLTVGAYPARMLRQYEAAQTEAKKSQ